MFGRTIHLAVAAASLSIASVASADLIGISVENANAANTGVDLDSMGLVAWCVYVNFSDAADQVLGVGGDIGHEHQFSANPLTGGIWDATNNISDVYFPGTGESGDSYIAIGDTPGTTVTPGWGGGNPFAKLIGGMSWNAAEEGSFRPGGFAGLKVLIGQFVVGDVGDDVAFTYSGRLAWRDADAPGAIFENFTVQAGGAVPAPGALALLGLAGIAGRRRRRRA